MTLQSILTAAVFAMSAALSLGANAASDAPAEAKEQPAKVAAKKTVKPHNHMEEKSGIPAKTPEKQAEAPKKLHDHQRDMK